jgi:hypothetical protein
MKKHYYILLAGIVLLSACRKNGGTFWESEYLAPVAKAEISLDQMNSANLFNKTGDSSYSLEYSQLVYSSNRLEGIRIPDTVVTRFFTLKALRLNDQNISRRITLAEINPVFILLNGSTQVIPAQNLTNLTPVDLDASAFFEYATLDSGWLNISLTNELQVNLSEVTFELRNKTDNSLISIETFNNVSPGTTQTRKVSLAGKTVYKVLTAQIKTLRTDASNGPVTIDAFKGVELNLAVTGLKPRAATAAFPSQNVLYQDEGTSMELGGPEIKFIQARRGTLRIRISTTIQENLTMIFRLPNVVKNGQSVERIIQVPAAVPGETKRYSEDVDMNGYVVDYRGKNPSVTDTVNTFHQIVIVNLDSSGRKVNVSLDDSIRVEYGIVGIEPEWAVGYFGQSDENISGVQPVTMYPPLGGSLEPEFVSMNLRVSNGIGAQGQVAVRSISSENVLNKRSVLLNAPGIVGATHTIQSADFQPWKASETNFYLNTGNSNIRDFLSNVPSGFGYDLNIKLNPNGNTNRWQDFLYHDKPLNVYLDASMPVGFRTPGLYFRDTQRMDLKSIRGIENAKKAVLRFYAENDFPVAVSMKAYLLDAFYQEIDSIIPQPELPAASVDQATGMVINRAVATLEAAVPEDRMENLRRASYIVFVPMLRTEGSAYRKLYSFYRLRIRLVGQVTMENSL